ncbi:hypothetical protein BGZ73_005729 [Actinomortierella ambigua]|nr:hypothetical protein BGZ73_005729 [Actinomortierella ambigua]
MHRAHAALNGQPSSSESTPAIPSSYGIPSSWLSGAASGLTNGAAPLGHPPGMQAWDLGVTVVQAASDKDKDKDMGKDMGTDTDTDTDTDMEEEVEAADNSRS